MQPSASRLTFSPLVPSRACSIVPPAQSRPLVRGAPLEQTNRINARSRGPRRAGALASVRRDNVPYDRCCSPCTRAAEPVGPGALLLSPASGRDDADSEDRSSCLGATVGLPP